MLRVLKCLEAHVVHDGGRPLAMAYSEERVVGGGPVLPAVAAVEFFSAVENCFV